MLKKNLVLIIISSFSLVNLMACSTSDNTFLLDETQLQTVDNQNIQTNSFSGVMREIKNAGELAFKELDKNADKFINPEEYGVSTEDSAKAFYALDKNHDGKITKEEFSPNFLNRVGLTFRLKSAASSLFKQLDKNKDKLLSKDELNNTSLVSKQFLDSFEKYDKQKKTLFHKDAKDMLSLSEFEDLFAYIAINNLGNTTVLPPSDPAIPTP